MTRALKRLVRTVRRREDDRGVDAEIDLHLEMEAAEFIRAGVPEDEARRRARVAFGSVERVRVDAREIRRLTVVEACARDARHGLRGLVRDAGFSTTVLVVLALTVGAVTTVFALLDAIVLRPLPFPAPDRLVSIAHAAPGLHEASVGLSSGLYFSYRDRAHSLDALGIYTETVLNVRARDAEPVRAQVTYANAGFFRVLGVAPALGRLFTDEDGAPGFMDARWPIPVLLAHQFWVDRLGADPNVIGRMLTMNDLPRRIVGVLPEGFAFPAPDTDIWMLSEPPAQTANFARSLSYHAIARLRAGATPAGAQAELARILPSLVNVYPDATAARMADLRLAPIVTPLKRAIVRDVADAIWILFAGMAVLLLIGCANVAALFFVRADRRRAEIAIRRALGAERWQIVRLFVIDALLLTGVAAVLGLLVARCLLTATRRLVPIELPRASEIGLHADVLASAAGLACLMAIGYGVLSVRRPWTSAAVGSRGAAPRITTARTSGRLGDPLVAFQMALALVLLVGSALMMTTFWNLSRVDLGFSPDHVLAIDVSLPYREAPQHVRIYHDVVDRVRQVPGVDDASAASFAPLMPAADAFPVEASESPVLFKFFVPGYFQMMNTRIIAGARFTPGEPIAASNPVLISAALADRLYPGQNAIGRSIERLNADGTPVTTPAGALPPFTIAGIVANVRETTLRDASPDVVYVPLIEPRVERLIVPTDMTILVRTGTSPERMATAVKAAVIASDPALSIGQVRTLDAIVRAARARETFVGALLLFAAAVSCSLGLVGVYGSVSQVVGRRTREIGIRIALGAQPRDVRRLVVGGAMRAVGVGALAGVILAFAATRALRALLFGVTASNPAIVIGATAALVAAGLAAAVLAARRATRIEPVIALQVE